MNKTIGIQLVVYGLLLAGVSYLTYHLAPAIARPTFIAGLAGGALCLVWGIRAIAGTGGKAFPILTLVPVSFVLLSQTVICWSAVNDAISGSRAAAAVVTLVFVMSIAMLMRIAYAGVAFDGQPGSPASDGATKPQTAGKPATQGDAAKRA